MVSMQWDYRAAGGHWLVKNNAYFYGGKSSYSVQLEPGIEVPTYVDRTEDGVRLTIQLASKHGYWQLRGQEVDIEINGAVNKVSPVHIRAFAGGMEYQFGIASKGIAKFTLLPLTLTDGTRDLSTPIIEYRYVRKVEIAGLGQ